MKLSFIIPAFNEEKLIGACIDAINASVKVNRKFVFRHEIIVVDNNSDDRTAELAADAGASVVFEPVNQIARARNTGASAATGDWFVFIDADSELNPALLTDVLALIESEAYVGCGSVFEMVDVPWAGRLMLNHWSTISVWFRWAAGSFVACRADAFRELGGFSEELFVTEEIDLSRRLKRWGRKRGLKFTVLKEHPLRTSNRKFELYSQAEMIRQSVSLSLRPRKAVRDRDALGVWYDGRR